MTELQACHLRFQAPSHGQIPNMGCLRENCRQPSLLVACVLVMASAEAADVQVTAIEILQNTGLNEKQYSMMCSAVAKLDYQHDAQAVSRPYDDCCASLQWRSQSPASWQQTLR